MQKSLLTVSILTVPILILSLSFCLLFLLGCSQDEEPLLVGFVGTLTGRLSDLGVAVRNGVLVAVDEINAQGGIQGRPLQLLVQDDENDALKGGAILREMKEKGVVAVIGHTTSQMSMAALPLLNELELIMISPTSTSNELTGLDDFFFRVSQPNRMEAQLMADFIWEKGLKEMNLIYDLSNRSYSQDWLNNFQEIYQEIGGVVLVVEDFFSDQGEDFPSLAQALIEPGADGILIIAGANDTAMLCQQLRLKGYLGSLFTTGWAKGPELIQGGGSSVQGLYLTHVFHENYQGQKYLSFVAAYQERFHVSPSFGAAFGYDAVMALQQVLLTGEEVQGKGLKEAFLRQDTFSGLQGDFLMDEYGDPDREYFLFQVEGGSFHPILYERNLFP